VPRSIACCSGVVGGVITDREPLFGNVGDIRFEASLVFLECPFFFDALIIFSSSGRDDDNKCNGMRNDAALFDDCGKR
jgi:hypothetical protein